MRLCSICNNSIRASDKWENRPDGTKQHLNCVYPEQYQPSKAHPGVRKLMLQSLSHRRIQTEKELALVLAETKRLLQNNPPAQEAIKTLRKQNG
jgi:hypothetical protein